MTKGSGSEEATRLSETDVAQLSMKQNRSLQQSENDVPCTGDSALLCCLVTEAWSCAPWVESEIDMVIASADAVVVGAHRSAIAVVP